MRPVVSTSVDKNMIFCELNNSESKNNPKTFYGRKFSESGGEGGITWGFFFNCSKHDIFHTKIIILGSGLFSEAWYGPHTQFYGKSEKCFQGYLYRVRPANLGQLL